ncbi:MAG: M48 family metalloprotease [Streptosporangiales bacterium]|nr:M48 family metalloprotease [Streptosporangiales bacterium]
MRVALVLLGYAILLGTVGVSVLRRAHWVDRAPRLAILAWFALIASILGSVVLGGLSLAVPIGQVSGDLAELLRSCAMALRAQYATPGGAAVGIAGATLAAAVVMRVACCAVAGIARAALRRHRHRGMLAMVGRHDPRLGAVIVEHDVPAAYCLPGRRKHVVLTSAALRALADDEIVAVLAHERAHLRGHHHIVTGAAAATERAFPFVAAFTAARREVDRLVELLADDTATRSCSRLAVADALLTVAATPAPAGALGAGGSSTAHRVRRLLRSELPLTRTQRLARILAAAAILAIPVLVSAAPAVAVTQTNHCPITVQDGTATPSDLTSSATPI